MAPLLGPFDPIIPDIGDTISVPDLRLERTGNWLIGLAILAFLLSLVAMPPTDLAPVLLGHQDRWLLLVGALLLSFPWIRRGTHDTPFIARGWLLPALAALLVMFCLAGHYWVLAGYDLSRDEQMAAFDATVFSTGHLVQPIPALWRDHADALNTLFMYPAVQRGAWISAYLPVNAALRALVGMLAAPALYASLMTAIGAMALWGCARRIWPQDREVPIVALLLYVGSGQVLVTGMTSYAMPAHLAFNLVWLWLFLRRAWWADAVALVVGLGAVGLHQPLMHPLFAGPLLFLLLIRRQWPRASFYAVGYAAIGVFWLWWPNWTWSLVQAYPGANQPAGVDYFTRLSTTVLAGDWTRHIDMIANLLRFVAWQHLLLMPLMVVGWRATARDGLARALAFGVLITVVVMAIILPSQGLGLGYRYLHGLLGNCILLAVYGWKSLEARRSAWRPLLVRTTIAGIIVGLPLQLWMVHAQYAPVAAVDARVAAADADYIVVGDDYAPYSLDLVHNPPALGVRPIRLLAGFVDSSLATAMCRSRPRVALANDRMFDRMNAYFGFAPNDKAMLRNRVLAPRLAAAGCHVAYMP